MKNVVIAAILITLFTAMTPAKTFYDFKVKTIDGKDFDLSSLKGKKVLVVNTASECGLTPQYEALEKLFKTYGGARFTIIGFPANNFGAQEPGTNVQIAEFCKKNYGVSFVMMEKISVKGSDIHPLYQWLTTKAENGVQDAPVTWNFQKFMISADGKWAGVAEPTELPDSEKIVNWIKS